MSSQFVLTPMRVTVMKYIQNISKGRILDFSLFEPLKFLREGPKDLYRSEP